MNKTTELVEEAKATNKRIMERNAQANYLLTNAATNLIYGNPPSASKQMLAYAEALRDMADQSDELARLITELSTAVGNS